MSQSEFTEKEEVKFRQKRGGRVYELKAVVVKVNKKYIRIKAKNHQGAWEFSSVRPEELEKVNLK